MKVGLVYDPRMMKHENEGYPHPEQPARISKIYDVLVEQGLVARCEEVAAREATVEELRSVHEEGYVDLVTEHLPTMGARELRSRANAWNSIYLNKHSTECALLSAGATVAITHKVATGELTSGVAVVRPPGHHAEAHCAMGFCLFNNVAIAAKLAVDSWGLERVLIVDWDVHHGNGTQNMFLKDPRVLYFSAHRYDSGTFYPGPCGSPSIVGEGAGAGKNVNVGWNHGPMGDADYLAAWRHILMPIATEFNPQLVLVSAGFDAAEGDPLGGQKITPTGYAHLTRALQELAGGRVVVVLEGGYNLKSISESFASVTRTLLGDTVPEFPATSRTTASLAALRCVRSTAAAHARLWSRVDLDAIDADISAAEERGDHGRSPPPSPPSSDSDSDDDTESASKAGASAAAETSRAAGVGASAGSSGGAGAGAGAGAGSDGDADAAAAVAAAAAGFEVTAIRDCPHVPTHVRVQDRDSFAALLSARCCHAGDGGCGSSAPARPSRTALLCLHCGQFFCRRDEAGHMVAHFGESRHAVVLDPDDLSAWCYECDGYLDGFAMPELFRAYSAAHEVKFGEAPAVPPSLIIHLEAE